MYLSLMISLNNYHYITVDVQFFMLHNKLFVILRDIPNADSVYALFLHECMLLGTLTLRLKKIRFIT